MREYQMILRERDGTRRRVVLWAYSIAEIAETVDLRDVIVVGEAGELFDA